jgi:hypothetical protein
MPISKQTLFFNASFARNLAESKWGRPHIGFKTQRFKTNRKGAFYFDCSGGSGFIIDGRCLTQTERDAIKPYCEADTSYEYFDEDGQFQMRTNPYTSQYNRKPAHRPKDGWRAVPNAVYTFRTGKDVCLPVIFADIHTEQHNLVDALKDFQRRFGLSAHDMIEIHSMISERTAA